MVHCWFLINFEFRGLSDGHDPARTLSVAVGDFRRFANARQLMAYLGLVPSEHSSGSTIRRAGITKAGNALARRVLIEGAWTYRMSARVSRKLHDRLEPLSAAIRDIAWKAHVRLCARYRLSLSQTQSGWRLIENWAMLRPDVGFVQTDLWNGDGSAAVARALEAEVLVLRQQINVLRRTRSRRPPFISIDRLILGAITERRTRINRPDDGSARCRDSRVRDQPNDFCPSTPPPTTPSTSSVTSSQR
jgi:hypothetical protein